MADRLLLQGLRFYGYHGVEEAEQGLGQNFVVDLLMELDLKQAGASDDLADTVNYAAVYQLARTIVEGPACKLIETVASRLAAAILSDYHLLTAVTVRLNKPQAPAHDPALGSITVELRRER